MAEAKATKVSKYYRTKQGEVRLGPPPSDYPDHEPLDAIDHTHVYHGAHVSWEHPVHGPGEGLVQAWGPRGVKAWDGETSRPVPYDAIRSVSGQSGASGTPSRAPSGRALVKEAIGATPPAESGWLDGHVTPAQARAVLEWASTEPVIPDPTYRGLWLDETFLTSWLTQLEEQPISLPALTGLSTDPEAARSHGEGEGVFVLLVIPPGLAVSLAPVLGKDHPEAILLADHQFEMESVSQADHAVQITLVTTRGDGHDS